MTGQIILIRLMFPEGSNTGLAGGQKVAPLGGVT